MREIREQEKQLNQKSFTAILDESKTKKFEVSSRLQPSSEQLKS